MIDHVIYYLIVAGYPSRLVILATIATADEFYRR